MQLWWAGAARSDPAVVPPSSRTLGAGMDSAQAARCVQVSTGMRAHEVTRYLTARATGRAVAEGLAGD